MGPLSQNATVLTTTLLLCVTLCVHRLTTDTHPVLSSTFQCVAAVPDFADCVPNFAELQLPGRRGDSYYPKNRVWGDRVPRKRLSSLLCVSPLTHSITPLEKNVPIHSPACSPRVLNLVVISTILSTITDSKYSVVKFCTTSSSQNT